MDFLLEIGAEEIPADYVEPALAALAEGLGGGLDERGLSHGEIRRTATPRRLAVHVGSVGETADVRTREVIGPKEAVAFRDGRPTKAAEGFARGQGVAVEDLVVRDTSRGRCVVAARETGGEPAAEVLADAVPAVVAGLPFPKSMRWKGREIVFARPIRWLVALLGTEEVPVRFAGLVAGRRTWGHPFLAPGPVELSDASWEGYLERLETVRVMADREVRARRIREGLKEVAEGLGGTVDEAGLVDEVVHLVEWPQVVGARFDPRYLDLPVEVLRSSMMAHQRYFPVTGEGGGLLPAFAFVANRIEVDAIREGNQRVLAARLADARFFVKEDRRRSLRVRAAELDRVVFQERLGTYAEKQGRLAKVARHLGEAIGLGAEVVTAAVEAAGLAKADLTTGVVGEFPLLQGVMGAYYARLDGESEVVADAIREHYLPRGSGDPLPRTEAGALLALAERLDNVTGAFAIGYEPTGSTDPFALRRQALGFARIVEARGWRFRLSEAVAASRAALPAGIGDASQVDARILAFFQDRLYHLYLERGVQHDLVRACIATGADDVVDLGRRIEAVVALSADPCWSGLVEVVERTFNITRGTHGNGDGIDPGRLVEDAERALYETWAREAGSVEEMLREGRYLEGARRYHEVFGGPVHRFFAEVFVNVDDGGVRENRLRILRSIHRLFAMHLADLSMVPVAR